MSQQEVVFPNPVRFSYETPFYVSPANEALRKRVILIAERLMEKVKPSYDYLLPSIDVQQMVDWSERIVEVDAFYIAQTEINEIKFMPLRADSEDSDIEELLRHELAHWAVFWGHKDSIGHSGKWAEEYLYVWGGAPLDAAEAMAKEGYKGIETYDERLGRYLYLALIHPRDDKCSCGWTFLDCKEGRGKEKKGGHAATP